jgi:adhesin/invasin
VTRQRFTRSRSWQAAAAAGLVCGLAAAGLASCDKMPLSAPTESTITLYANSTTVGLNGSVDITALVIESSGTPVQNGTVVNFTTTLGTIDPNEARTNNGKAVAKLLAGTKSGTAEVRAFSGGIASGDPLAVTVGAAAVSKVELLANPSSLPAQGGTVQLIALVSDASGNRVSGVAVNFTADAGLLAQSSVTSDGNGEARTSLSTTSAASVTASVAGGSGEGASANLGIPVRVGPSITISAPAGSLVPGVPATFGVTVTAGGAAVKSATIDFGDGGTQSVSTSGFSAVTHTYLSSGSYTVRAVATDNVGESATATGSVSVQAVVVSVNMTVSPTTVQRGALAEFTASATTTPAGTTIERYEWNFGDGAVATTSGNATNHSYATAGRYVASVRAVTTTGASGTAQREIVVQ